MSDKPILFSGPMVRALLAGTKTQTRRLMKPQPELQMNGFFHVHNRHGGLLNVAEEDVGSAAVDYLRIAVGDRLYVREAWRCNGWATDVATIMYRASEPDGYTAMTEQYPVEGKKPQRVTGTWRPGIHMPTWASRITLRVTDVRVQPLHEISEADALAEGMTQETANAIMNPDELALFATTHILCPDARGRLLYQHIWDQINGTREVPEPWALNPWVAAYTFEVERANVAQARAS